MTHISPNRFTGKIVLVTGAAQGIGRAVALRAAAEGATLVLVDRSELIHDAAAEIGGTVLAVTADMENYAGASDAVAQGIERFGRIDVLLNNVGGTIWMRPFAEYTEAQIEAEIHRSLFPTLWCCRAILPCMSAQGGGVIVNVSSVATRGVNRVPYAAAKGGVNAITTCLAIENAEHGIRVCGVAPGGTEAPPRKILRNTAPPTPQDETWIGEVVAQTISSSLLKRYGTTEEQAAAILFLASDEASYITGVTIPVAGGDLG